MFKTYFKKYTIGHVIIACNLKIKLYILLYTKYI